MRKKEGKRFFATFKSLLIHIMSDTASITGLIGMTISTKVPAETEIPTKHLLTQGEIVKIPLAKLIAKLTSQVIIRRLKKKSRIFSAVNASRKVHRIELIIRKNHD